TRLSLSLMGCNPELVSLGKDQRLALGLPAEGPLHLASLYGTINGITEPKKLDLQKELTPENTTFGVTGEFEGKNIVTGQLYQAGIFYLPSGFHDKAIERARVLSDGEVVDFVWHFFSVAASNPRHYSWLLKSGLPADMVRDPLADLRKRALSVSGQTL